MIKLIGREGHVKFKEDKIWVNYLPEMGSLSSKNSGVKYLWCLIDAFTKYSWVKLSLKGKKR